MPLHLGVKVITLRPYDIVVAIKVGLNNMYKMRHPVQIFADHDYLDPEWRSAPIGNSTEELSLALDLSVSEVECSLERLTALNMLTLVLKSQEESEYVFHVGAMTQFLCLSLRHVMQPETSKKLFRGMPCGWDCPWAESEMNPPHVPWVWPDSDGPVYGEGVEPFYLNMTRAVRLDPGLYKALALIEPIRLGKPRDCIHGRKAITDWLSKLRSS